MSKEPRDPDFCEAAVLHRYEIIVDGKKQWASEWMQCKHKPTRGVPVIEVERRQLVVMQCCTRHHRSLCEGTHRVMRTMQRLGMHWYEDDLVQVRLAAATENAA